jgi:Cu(I)/Ag(I) efflux system protein CusF
MRVLPLALLAIALSAVGPALAHNMDNMPGIKQPAQAVKTGTGFGVITAIDARGGTLTVKHGPIPSVGWPAMTMMFKAHTAALLHGLHVGQKIAFDAKVKGMNAEVRRSIWRGSASFGGRGHSASLSIRFRLCSAFRIRRTYPARQWI